MKILITCDPGLPVPPIQYGGVERMVSGVCRGFHEAGHEVILLASRGSLEENVDKIYFWPADSSTGSWNIVRNAIKLLGVANHFKPDVIHSFSRMLFLYPLLLQGKFPIVESFGRLMSHKTLKWARHCDRCRQLYFTVCGAHMLNDIADKTRWRVIANFLNMEFFVPASEATTSREYLVFLGMICRQKGTHLAIEAARKSNCKLLIAGIPGDLAIQYFENQIQPELSDQIQFIGPVDDMQKRTLLQNARGLLFPITGPEAFGLVVIESMACGTPVIGLRRYSVPELIESGENGFICDNVDQMSDAIQQLDKIDRLRVRKSVESRFDYREICKQYLNFFEEIQTS